MGVTIVIGVLLNRASIYNELVTLDLLPKPEKLTELYFNNSANLPGHAASNQAISFTFVIHNLETTDCQYVYDVSVNANGARRIVDSGRVFVKDSQYYIKSESFNLMSAPGSQNVTVELTNKRQSIGFWTGK